MTFPDTLEELLREATKREMTPKQQYEQRVSWLIGMNWKRDVTREEAVQALARAGIYDPEPERQALRALETGDREG